MSDLGGAIREWFSTRLETMPCDDDIEAHESLQMAAHAVIAVLDLHKPRSAGIVGKPHIADCSVCMDVSPEVCSPVGYPCETVEAVAEKLGISLSG
jgi:hypothetical protein